MTKKENVFSLGCQHLDSAPLLIRLEYIMLLNLPISSNSFLFYVLFQFLFLFSFILPLGQQSSYLQLQTT